MFLGCPIVVEEVQALLAVDHPHIVRLYDVFESPQSFALAMELCPGGHLLAHAQQVGDRFGEEIVVMYTRLGLPKQAFWICGLRFDC